MSAATDNLMNLVRREAARLVNATPRPRLGVVTSMDPSGPRVRVLYAEERVETGWLPVMTQSAGNGWGIHAPPQPGAQVLVMPVDGQAGAGVVLGAIWSQVDRPATPANVPGGPAAVVTAGEVALVHASGAVVRLAADGTIYMQAARVNVAGDLFVTGRIEATGDVTDLAGAHGSLAVLRTAYDLHRHTGVQTGGGTSQTTDHPV